jgi:dUTPase
MALAWRDDLAHAGRPEHHPRHKGVGPHGGRIPMIEFWLSGSGAQAPEQHAGAALDLRARLPQHGWRLVWGVARIPTGIALRIPEASVVRVTGRSGNFLRGIMVHDGLVESEFNGQELCVLIYCPWPRIIRHGQRIAQMWALAVDRQAFRQLPEAPQGLLPGKAGFGSTGRV